MVLRGALMRDGGVLARAIAPALSPAALVTCTLVLVACEGAPSHATPGTAGVFLSRP